MSRYLIGDTLLDQFRVDAFIATGGMSAVYRVWDLQRNVPLAMKVLNADLSRDPAFIHRFEREARALESLAHPNIVSFYGLHQTPDLTFLLERFVDGPSLSEILRFRAGAPFSIAEMLVYLKCLAAGLGYAHSKGIIHCDIKPGNVLVDQGGHIYLTDFGIAKYTESVTATTYAAIGTPAYMAPEQIRSERVSPQTDIYSLGVLIYELLTGKRPFRGDEEMPTTEAGVTQAERIRYAHLNLAPPNPSQIDPEIPEELGQSVMAALAKDPADRYPSIQEMAQTIFQSVRTRIDLVPDRIHLPDELLSRWNSSNPLFRTEAQDPYRDEVPALPASLHRPAIPNWMTRRMFLSLAAVTGLVVFFFLIFANRQAIQGFFPTAKARVLAPGSTNQPPAGPGPQSTSGASHPFTTQGEIALVVRQAGKDHLFLVDAATSRLSALPDPPDAQWSWGPQWSPDGSRLVWFSRYNSKDHVVVLDFHSGQRYEVNASGDYSGIHSPAWLPDGKQISFWATRSQSYWLVVADGTTGQKVEETQLPSYRNQFVWNWKNRMLAFTEKPGQQYVVVISGSSQTDDRVIQTDGETYAPSWSNDGNWLAFQSDSGRASGEDEIWMVKKDGSDLHQVTHSPAGIWSRAPSWSPDGSQIAFVSNQGGSLRGDYGELFITEVATGAVQQVTQTGGQVYDWRPGWRPK